jgi:hypothetical protein
MTRFKQCGSSRPEGTFHPKLSCAPREMRRAFFWEKCLPLQVKLSNAIVPTDRSVAIRLMRTALRHPWNNKPHRSWPKLMHAEIIERAAVATTLFYYLVHFAAQYILSDIDFIAV